MSSSPKEFILQLYQHICKTTQEIHCSIFQNKILEIRVPSAENWLLKMWYVHIQDYFAPIIRNQGYSITMLFLKT